MLFTTSTRDDRVHPGHARKMMAKMEAACNADVRYYENIEGGHGGASNNQQAAHNVRARLHVPVAEAEVIAATSSQRTQQGGLRAALLRL